MHEPGGDKLTHPRVDDREAGTPLAPRVKELHILAPFDRVVVPIKGVTEYVREVPCDMGKEITPIDLSNEGMPNTKRVGDDVVDLSNRNGAELVVWRKKGCSFERWDVSLILVVRVALDPFEDGERLRASSRTDPLRRGLLRPKIAGLNELLRGSRASEGALGEF